MTSNDIAALTTELAQRGIILPATIERVTSGNFGVCLISENEVLKLFVDSHYVGASFFHASIQNFSNLAIVAAEIAERGVTVPQLLDYGKFPKAVRVGRRTYYAWQRMTRVEGKEMPPIDRGQLGGLIIKNKRIHEITKIAAKLHVRVEVGSRDVFQDLGSYLSWAQHPNLRIDTKTHNLLIELQKDILRFTPSEKSTTLLHRDLHTRNILKNTQGRYGVIDWDEQQFGRPECDLAVLFCANPPRTKELCAQYNSMATKPIDEKLIIAYGLAGYCVGYFNFLAHQKSELRRTQMRAVHASQIAALAERMYQLTHKKIYADMAKDYSAANPLRLRQPAQRRLPFNRLSGGPKV